MQRSRKRSSSGPPRSSSEYSSASSPAASIATQSGSSDLPPRRYSDDDDPREYHDNNSRPSMENEDSADSSDGESPQQEHNYEENWPDYQNDSIQYHSQNDEYEHNQRHSDVESYDDQSNRSPSPSGPYSREVEGYEDSDDRNADYTNDRYNDHRNRGDDDGASTQSESEEGVNEPSNGSVTEEESERSPSPVMPRLEIRHRSMRPVVRSRPSFNWSSYHPVVRTASELCWLHGVEPSSIAYGRILSAGKGSIDYYIRSRSVTIGRWGYGTDCQIRSETRSISRKHAKLYWDAKVDHWMLTCLSAKNGLVVDGAPIAPFGLPVPVRSQSLVEIGDVAFYFLSVAEKSFRVNDLKMLEQRIIEAREAEATANHYEEVNGTSDHDVEQETSPRRSKSKSEGPTATGSKLVDLKSSKSKKRAKSSLQPVKDATSSDLSLSEDEDQVVPDVLDAPHYRLPVIQLSTKKKRRGGTERSGGSKKRRKRDRSYEDEGSGQESASYTEEWNKKEKTDFARALFAVGVDPYYDDEGNVAGFDWSRFRGIVDFPKKSDEMLEEHYRRVMADVQEFLDGDERDKKVKGARNNHAPSCKCMLCNDNDKSTKRKRINGEDHDDDDKTGGQSKSKEPLMSLVTAQKLRVRIGILEAARRVDTKIWESAIAKLDTQLQSSLKEFPDWWQRWVHDRDLMRGCAQHGVGQWSQIWNDSSLKSFVELRKTCDEGEEMIEWPSNQAAMKRVRELGLAMMSEMRRVAKHDAEEERKKRRIVRKKERKAAKKQVVQHNHEEEAQLTRNSSFRSQIEESGGEYEIEVIDEHITGDGQDTDEGESTAEDSGSEDLDIVRVERADEVETEEENNDREDLIQRDEGEESVEDRYGEVHQETRHEERPSWVYSEEEFDGEYGGSETEEE